VTLQTQFDLVPKWLQNEAEFRSATMPNLSIKDVPEAWAEALRQRAIRHHRSLQGELMAIVEAAIASAFDSPASPLLSAPPLPALIGVPPGLSGSVPSVPGSKTVQQVMAELRLKHPEVVANAPLGRDIVRAERDAR
jgi:plasmid stability protein